MLQKNYILNPFYTLVNDRKRTLLTNTPAFKIPQGVAEEDISSKIHPMYGILLSYFDGKNDLETNINRIKHDIDMEFEDIFNVIKPLIENKKRVGLEYDDVVFEFPINILVKFDDKNMKCRQLSPKSLIINEDIDIYHPRLFNAPSEISLLINTNCVTDCVYCYVDNRIKSNGSLPIERLSQIIKESKELGVVNFDISGTELFLYKNWHLLLKELIDNGYYPYVSTKMPLTEKQILMLYEIGIKHIQISVDTIDPIKATKINKIKDENYFIKLDETFNLLCKHGFEIKVNIVLTKENSSLSEIDSLFNHLSQFSCLQTITINPAGRSVYKDANSFNDFKITLQEYNNISDFIDDINNSKKYKFNITLAGISFKSNYYNTYEKKLENFNDRSQCTANIEKMCILSDGKVTTCEELYWNEKFIIGDILKSSIKEIWNSQKALSLYNFSRNDFSDESVCKTCSNFESCRNSTGTCFSETLMAFGEDKWDFPDPSCPNAPEPIHNLHHENK